MKLVDEQGRKKEMAELRAIFKKWLEPEVITTYRDLFASMGIDIKPTSKYHMMHWNQHTGQPDKNGLSQITYVIESGHVSDAEKDKSFLEELDAWLNKPNPNRIKACRYRVCGNVGMTIKYKYKQY